MTEKRREASNAGFSQVSPGPGIEVLNWKCEHTSVYSAIHTADPVVPQETIDQAKGDLLAYYATIATCGCTPVTVQP